MARTTPRIPTDEGALTPSNSHRSPDQQQATTTGTRRIATRVVRRPRDFYCDFPRKLTVSSLGIGTYLGDCTDVEDEMYSASVLEAIASGINVIDTAINYRCQRSERAVGKVLEDAISAGSVRRDEILVCSKGGYVALDGTPPASRQEYEQYVEKTLFTPGVIAPGELARGGHSISPGFIRYQLERSRANLRLRTIDLYYLHNPEEQLLVTDRETFRARLRAAFELLEERAEAGDIAGYGCATWFGLRVTPDQRQHLSLSELVAAARDVGGPGNHFKAVMAPFSLAMPEAARTPTQQLGRRLVPLFEATEALGLGMVVSAPLMQGQLTAGLPNAIQELFPHCTTDAQRALRFAASLPSVTTVLAGMRRPEHVRENLDAWRWPLSRDELSAPSSPT